MRKLPGFVLLMTVALTLPSTARAGDSADASKFPGASMPPVVRGEYDKQQSEMQEKLSDAKRRLLDLESERGKAFAAAQTQAQVEQSGVESFKKYDQLITVRYVDNDGDEKKYMPGIELSDEDKKNINELFENYLHMTPLDGVVSAGIARNTLEWGVEFLEHRIKIHSSPNEDNNSEFQIISKKKKDTEREVKQVLALADKLGVKLNEQAVATSPSDGGDRMPASK